MKFLIFTIIGLVTATTALSQEYKQFEWDVVGISPLVPTSKNIGNALGFYTEARFNLNNSISVGLNYSWQFFDELFEEPIRSAGVTTAYAITGDYYVFNDLNKRAFASFALGSFDNRATTESGEAIGGAGIGCTPRIGYELNFIRAIVSYNYTFKEDFPNYFAIGFGLNIGGRYIKPTPRKKNG